MYIKYEKPMAKIIDFDPDDDILTGSTCPGYVCVSWYGSACETNTYDCTDNEACTAADASPF